jgi:hypothetical protein
VRDAAVQSDVVCGILPATTPAFTGAEAGDEAEAVAPALRRQSPQSRLARFAHK